MRSRKDFAFLRAIFSAIFIAFTIGLGLYAAIACVARWPLQPEAVWFGVSLACIRSASLAFDEVR